MFGCLIVLLVKEGFPQMFLFYKLNHYQRMVLVCSQSQTVVDRGLMDIKFINYFSIVAHTQWVMNCEVMDYLHIM